MEDDKKILQKAGLVPFNFTLEYARNLPTTPEAQKAEREKIIAEHREQVRRNIIAMTITSPETYPPAKLSYSDLDQLTTALSTPKADPGRSYIIKPDTPLPPTSSIDTSRCNPYMAQVMRAASLIEMYDKASADTPDTPSTSQASFNSPVLPKPVIPKHNRNTTVLPKPSSPAQSRTSAVQPKQSSDTQGRTPAVQPKSSPAKHRNVPTLTTPTPRPKSPPKKPATSADGRRQTINPDTVSRRESMGSVRSSIPEDRVEGFVRPGVPAVGHGSVIDASRDPRRVVAKKKVQGSG